MVIAQSTGVVTAQAKSSVMLSLQEQGRKFIATGMMDPFVTGFLVFAISLGLNAIKNTISYVEKRKTGKQAVSDTFRESSVMGAYTVIGVAAGNAIAATGLVLIAPAVLTMTAGLTATFVVKNFLDERSSRVKEASKVVPSVRKRAVRRHRATHRSAAMALS